MKRPVILFASLCIIAAIGGAVFFVMGGDTHSGHGGVLPKEAGQSGFAAIQEITGILMDDPDTDWDKVNIEALRLHLIDMENLTMRARVAAQNIPDGIRFTATSDAPDVAASIKTMVPAHAATMDGVEGWRLIAEEIPGGAALSVTGVDDVARIRALGFIGVMTVGAHHQAHHIAIASGADPHSHGH